MAAVAAVLLLGGCSGAQDEPAAAAATEFLRSVDARNGAAACDLLAPAAREEMASTAGKACALAVLEVELGPVRGRPNVRVFDSMAQVLVGSQTLFLSTYDGRWLVVAAACTAVPHRPYDCSIGLP